MINRLSFAFTLVFIFFLGACARSSYDLTVIHTNDVHAHIAPFNNDDAECSETDRAQNQCFGGIARQKSAIDGIRKEASNNLLLDAGDHIAGSIYFTLFKGEASQYFMNAVQYNAMTVGNHEFDGGEATLATFLKGNRFPAVSVNVEPRAESPLTGLISPYTIVDVGKRQVAIVGYITEEASDFVSSSTKVDFVPIVQKLKNAIEEIQKKDINIIIALSHAGINKDIEVAKQVDGIDVIVGGHSHTLLSNSLSNSSTEAEDKYPIIAQSPSGKNVLIVSDGAYGKYLGRLNLTFDGEGNVTAHNGDTMLLDNKVPEDAVIKAKVDDFEKTIAPLRVHVYGKAIDNFPNKDCRLLECALGNLVADALASSLSAKIAVINGGSIRSGFSKGDISDATLMQCFPFNNTLLTITMSGSSIKEMLEHAVSQAEDSRNEGTGRFLQVSGLSFSWDPTRPVGARIKDIFVLQKGRKTPLALKQSYKVVAPSFIVEGGDGFGPIFSKAISRKNSTVKLVDAIKSYLTKHKQVKPQLEERIVRISPSK